MNDRRYSGTAAQKYYCCQDGSQMQQDDDDDENNNDDNKNSVYQCGKASKNIVDWERRRQSMIDGSS